MRRSDEVENPGKGKMRHAKSAEARLLKLSVTFTCQQFSILLPFWDKPGRNVAFWRCWYRAIRPRRAAGPSICMRIRIYTLA